MALEIAPLTGDQAELIRHVLLIAFILVYAVIFVAGQAVLALNQRTKGSAAQARAS